MLLSDRDYKVLQYTAKFRQLTAQHIGQFLFSELASITPARRSLNRLVNADFLARSERGRLIGGVQGGSGQYVYSLGRRGFQMFNDGVYRPMRTVSYHQLLTADTFMAAKRLERDGLLSIQGWATDLDAEVEVVGITLRPDLRLDVVRQDGAVMRMWIEVDMATEGRRQIKDKLAPVLERCAVSRPGSVA